MRADQINSLRKGDSKVLFELVSRYKDDVLSLVKALYTNKNNYKKLKDQDYVNLCTDAFIGILRKLKNAPSGYAFRNWLLKTVYENEIDKATKKDADSNVKNWKTFTVINKTIEQDKLLEKVAGLSVMDRLYIWASCSEGMSLEEAANFFGESADVYGENLMQALQGVKSRFPSLCKKVPESLNFNQLLTMAYSNLSPAEKLEYEKELQSHKIKNKFNENIQSEKVQFNSIYKSQISGSDLLANIRAKKRLVRGMNPFLWVSAEVLILLFIVALVVYISNIVVPADITVAVDRGSAKITASDTEEENASAITLKHAQNIGKDVTLNKFNVHDMLETDVYSSASCVIDDINSFQIGADAKIEALKPTSEYPLSFKLHKGLLWLDIVNSENKTKIVTDNSEYYTNGGQFIIETQSVYDKVLVFEGLLECAPKKNEKDVIEFTKNMAFSLTAGGKTLALDRFNARTYDKNNKYYFSIEAAENYYFDKNGKLKVLFHWLNSKNYPLAERQIPGEIIDQLHAFNNKYDDLNDVLMKLEKSRNQTRIFIERLYTRIKQLEKTFNHKIKESELIIMNQTELNELYEQLTKVKNTISSLLSGSYENSHYTDFSFMEKGMYSKESERWQSEIKKMRNDRLELSTLETVMQGVESDLKSVKSTKSNFETEITNLSNKLSTTIAKLTEIENSKKAIKTSESEIDKLNNALTGLKKDLKLTNSTLKVLNEELKKIDESISLVNSIDKQLAEYRKNLAEKQTQAKDLETANIENNSKLKSEQAKIDTTKRSLDKLTNDKSAYDKRLTELEVKIKEVTDKFNVSIEKRATTTMKLNDLKKEEILINMKLEKLQSEKDTLNKDLAKKEKLLESQNSAVSRFNSQIEKINSEMDSLSKEVEEFNKSIEENKKKIEKNNLKAQELKEAISVKRKELTKIEVSIEECRNNIDEFKKQLTSLQTKIKEDKSRFETLKSQTDKLKTKSEEAETRFINKQDELNEVQNQIEKLSADINAYNISIKTNKKELGELSEKVNTLQKTIKNKEKILSDYAIINMTSALRNHLIDFSKYAKVSQLSIEILVLSAQKIAYQNKIAELKKENKTIETNIKKIKDLKSAKNKQVTELSGFAQKLEKEYTQIKSDYEKAITNVNELQKEIDTKSKKLNEIETKLKTANGQLASIEKQKTSAKAEIQNIEEQIDELNQDTKTLEDSNKKLLSNIESNVALIETKKTQASIIKKKLDKFGEVRKTTKDDVAKFKNELDEINKSVTAEIEKKRKINEQKTTFETELASQKESIFNNQTELNKLKNEQANVLKIVTPLNKKCEVLEKLINDSNAEIATLKSAIDENNAKLTELSKNMSEVNKYIAAQIEQKKKYKPFSELNTEKESKMAEIDACTIKQNNFKRNIVNTEKSIEQNKNTIAKAKESIKTESKLNVKKGELEQKIAEKKTQLTAVNKDFKTLQTKTADLKAKIDVLKKKIEKLDEYEKNSLFWSHMYNEIIKTETALQLNSFKFDELMKEITTLENKVGEKVYLSQIEEIRKAKCRLNDLISEYKAEDKNYWYIIQLTDTATGDSSNSITNSINNLIEKTAEQFLPLMFDYDGFKISDDDKRKIIVAALRMFPEYNKLASSGIHSETIDQIHKTWRIQLMKMFNQDSRIDIIDTLTEHDLIIPE